MKTRLYTRKRALISSVAMLLVAMIALGTATFAWFTSSTTATADGLSVKTVKSSELKLSDDTNDWTDQLHYGTINKVLKPASSADGVNWYTANASAKGNYAASATPTAALTNLEGYVFKNQLNVTNAGGTAVNDVTISFSLTETPAVAGKKYLRLALVEANKKGTDADLTGNFLDGVYAAGSDTANAYTPNEEGTAVTTAKVDAADGSNVELNIGTLQASGYTPTGDTDTKTATKYFNLYVWFEGQDTDCNDTNAGNVMPEITFTVSGDNAA